MLLADDDTDPEIFHEMCPARRLKNAASLRLIADYHCMYENKAALRHAQDRSPQMAKVALAQALQTVTARMDRRESSVAVIHALTGNSL